MELVEWWGKKTNHNQTHHISEKHVQWLILS